MLILQETFWESLCSQLMLNLVTCATLNSHFTLLLSSSCGWISVQVLRFI